MSWKITGVPSSFLSWWGQELAGLVLSAAPSAESAVARIVLAVEPTGLRVVESMSGKGGQGLPPVGVVPTAAVIAYLASIARTRKGPRTVALRLPFSACFIRNVELPTLARRDFSRLLGLDLERSTPFKLKDVLTAFEVGEEISGKGLIRVRHLIVKRKSVDDLKAQIEALGLTVTRIECFSQDGTTALPVNFLAPKVSEGSGDRKRGGAAAILAAIALALLGSATYIYVERHEHALASVLAQLEPLKSKAQAQKELLAKAQAAYATIANYQKLRADTVSKVAVIEELTQLLSDSAWVTDLKLDNATLDISGLAQSAASLVPILERSTYFVDTTATASLTFDAREEKERFSIRARIRTPISIATFRTGGDGK